MKWSDFPSHPSVKVLRQFAAIWLVFFSAYGAYQYWAHDRHGLGLTIMVGALVIGGLGLLRPTAIRWIFVGWMKLAFPIGWMISQLSLALIFYGLIMPLAIFFRVFKRDLLLRKRPFNQASFWIPKEMPKDVRSYFRQY